MACPLCLPEWYGVSAAIRSIGSRVPSRITYASVRVVAIPSVRAGARVAGISAASRRQAVDGRGGNAAPVPCPTSAVAGWGRGLSVSGRARAGCGGPRSRH